MTADALKMGLPAVARPDARLFILGSLPGDASLGAARYYAHRTNQFWRLLGHVLGDDLPGLPYEARLDRLAERGIGLWDVIAAGRRHGSLDGAIRDARHNRIDQLRDYAGLRAIAFNGATAASAGRRLIGAAPASLALIDLPSSSAANTRDFAWKAEAWSALAPFVQP